VLLDPSPKLLLERGESGGRPNLVCFVRGIGSGPRPVASRCFRDVGQGLQRGIILYTALPKASERHRISDGRGLQASSRRISQRGTRRDGGLLPFELRWTAGSGRGSAISRETGADRGGKAVPGHSRLLSCRLARGLETRRGRSLAGRHTWVAGRHLARAGTGAHQRPGTRARQILDLARPNSDQGEFSRGSPAVPTERQPSGVRRFVRSPFRPGRQAWRSLLRSATCGRGPRFEVTRATSRIARVPEKP